MDENKNSLIEFDPADVEANKTAAGLAYIAFFIPLFMAPNSQYAKFNANQSLLILIGYFAAGIINVIPIIGNLISALLILILGIFTILGLVYGFTGKTTPLPLFDKINLTIIK